MMLKLDDVSNLERESHKSKFEIASLQNELEHLKGLNQHNSYLERERSGLLD